MLEGFCGESAYRCIQYVYHLFPWAIFSKGETARESLRGIFDFVLIAPMKTMVAAIFSAHPVNKNDMEFETCNSKVSCWIADGL